MIMDGIFLHTYSMARLAFSFDLREIAIIITYNDALLYALFIDPCSFGAANWPIPPFSPTENRFVINEYIDGK